MALAWTPKDPNDLDMFGFGFANWMPSGDSITGAPTIVISPPGGLTPGISVLNGTDVWVWLSGGNAGQSYKITCQITTAQGRVINRSQTLAVQYL
jgi:hypothetical protein